MLNDMTGETTQNTNAASGAGAGKKAAALAARLAAVQGIYQVLHNDKPARQVAADYLKHHAGMILDGEKMVDPDPQLFRQVFFGTDERFPELEAMVQANYKEAEKDYKIEPLIQAILLCATYEILACPDTDAPIIINDYLNVAHGFYERGEVALINAVLDNITKILRSE